VREKIAVAWYADRIRLADIAFVVKLPVAAVVEAVRRAGVPLRSSQRRTGTIPLLHPLRHIEQGASARALREVFELSEESVRGLFQLHREQAPPMVRRVGAADPHPPRRCQSCYGVSRGQDRCPYCQDPM
jgi:hypothetical protein